MMEEGRKGAEYGGVDSRVIVSISSHCVGRG